MKTIRTNSTYRNKLTDVLSLDFWESISLPVIICRLPDYMIIYVNRSAVNLYGFTKEEFYSRSFLDLTEPPADTDFINNSARKFNDFGGKIIQTHLTRTKKNVKVELILEEIVFEENDSLLVMVNEAITRKNFQDKDIEYTAILESTDDAIIGKTLDGLITSWNNGAEKMYGYSAGEAVGKSIELIIPPEKIPEFREIMNKLKRGEKVSHHRTKRVKKDGTEIIISVTVSPIISRKGTIIGASAIAKDITQNTLMENIIYESEERMKLALSAGRMGTWDWKFPNNSIEWNDYMYKIFGLDESGFSGKFEDFLQLVFPEDREKVHNDVEHAIENNLSYESEYRIMRPDGNTRFIMARGKLLKDDSGIPFRLIGICLDITEKKKGELEKDRLLSIEKKLRKKADNLKNRLSFLADSSRILSSSLKYETTLKTVARTIVPILADICAIDLVDNSGNVRRVEVVHRNPDKINLFYELSEKYKTTGEIIKEVIRSRKSKALYTIEENYLKEIATDGGHLSFLLSLNLKSALFIPLKSKEKIYGTLMFVMSDSGRYYNKEDLILAEELANRAAIAIENANLYREAKLSNIELEKRVKKRTMELEMLNKELETFSYSVSHDLRAPLRAIQGFSNILLEDFARQIDSEGKRLLNVIISNAGHMGNLIDDLLSFSRMTRTGLNYSDVDFNIMIKEILDEHKIHNREQKTEIKLEELPPVKCDPSMLRQVWINLITNAVKFSSKKEKPVIEIGSFKKKSETVYFIKDNGVGFDMQYADKLFGVFQRLHKASEFEGTGVGLAIIKKIITRHGGDIWAEGQLNKGASFFFKLGSQNE